MEKPTVNNAYKELIEALQLWGLSESDVAYITNSDFGGSATLAEFKREADRDFELGEGQQASVSGDLVVILKSGARYIRTPDPMAKTPYGLWEWYYIPALPASKPDPCAIEFDVRVDG